MTINKELITVLEDVFVAEGVVDTLKGLTTERSLRLAERYISNSLGVVGELIKSDKTAKELDQSKGDITKVSAYKDYIKIYTKLHNLEDGLAPKGFKEALGLLTKVHEFLTVDGKTALKNVYSGATKSRSGQLLFVGMALNQFLTAIDIFLSLIVVEGKTFSINPSGKVNLEGLKAFAQKADVSAFAMFVKNLPELEEGLVSESVIDTATGEPLSDTDDLDAIDDLEDEDDEEKPVVKEDLSPKAYRQYIREQALAKEDDTDFEHMPEAPVDPDSAQTVKELGYGEDDKPEDWDPNYPKNVSEDEEGETETTKLLANLKGTLADVARTALETQADLGEIESHEVHASKVPDRGLVNLILQVTYKDGSRTFSIDNVEADLLPKVDVQELKAGLEAEVKNQLSVKEDVEGSILALLGEDFTDTTSDTVLTEDSLKDFILNGVSNTGKKLMKGIEASGVKSEGLKAFLNKGVVKGVGAAMAVITMLFLVRYIVTLTFTLRVNLAQYLRETADIIDEQISAVTDTSVREKQEATSTKLKALAKKFDLDRNVATNKSERTNRDFDETILDAYTDEEIKRSEDEAGAIF